MTMNVDSKLVKLAQEYKTQMEAQNTFRRNMIQGQANKLIRLHYPLNHYNIRLEWMKLAGLEKYL